MKRQRRQWRDYGGPPPDFRRHHRGRHYHRPGHPPGFQRKQRFLYRRFLGFAVFLALPLLAVGIFLGFVIAGAETVASPALVLLAICGSPLLLGLLAVGIGSWAFRDVGAPLADVMAAADAMAEGDLSVRTPEKGPGEFRRLAHSFNRMAEELERAEQRRRNLTADVAHELRTPLHILQGNLEGILDGVYEPTTAHIQAMLEETHLLTRLIDDLQTLSQAEAGQLSLQMERVDIGELLMDVNTSFGGLAEAEGIRLQLDLPDEPLFVIADAERLDQVLSNLVANALRHTPAGGHITLAAEPFPTVVRISVSDTGEGIPVEDLPYVFDRFWRGDRARTRAVSAGSGLGLAIARQLVRAHGGQITVASTMGQGTTFVVELPVAE
ncbi:MAG TPA: HAMP domain-containing protein [Caldilineae bacterium]|nr:HAMP domain-containing protein [Caldilineae bacterium]